jgi:N2,N2-dimethylguanosine tRNA methyltransferase
MVRRVLFLGCLLLTRPIVLPTMEAYRSRESTVMSPYVQAPFQYKLLILAQALRLVLHMIATSAARYGRFITPLISLSIDFYVRLFVRVNTGALEVKRLARYARPPRTLRYQLKIS